MNNDHVEIEVASSTTKAKKDERIERTITSNYKFVSTMNPVISDLVFDLSWDSVNNMLTLSLKETQDFDAFRWFGTINERREVTQKSSFVDFDADAIILTFFNSADIELAKMKFRNLKLVSHGVCFGESHGRTTTNFGIDSPSGPMCHEIAIEYQDCQLFLREKDNLDDWEDRSLSMKLAK